MVHWFIHSSTRHLYTAVAWLLTKDVVCVCLSLVDVPELSLVSCLGAKKCWLVRNRAKTVLSVLILHPTFLGSLCCLILQVIVLLGYEEGHHKWGRNSRVIANKHLGCTWGNGEIYTSEIVGCENGIMCKKSVWRYRQQ